jgi:hypothetical protein
MRSLLPEFSLSPGEFIRICTDPGYGPGDNRADLEPRKKVTSEFTYSWVKE